MFPWLWLWMPQLHFPFSGSVDQNIEPNTNWFFGAIQPGAGNSQVEQKAFAVASYGKQLGLITDVLLSLADEKSVRPDVARDALDRLQQIRAQIEQIKTDDAEAASRALLQKLRSLRSQNRPEFDRLLARLQT